jgi:ABC-type Fe3+-hydroxamate transport system substrate-binding protein
MRDIHDIVDGLANLLGVPERGVLLNATMERQISKTALSIEALDIKNRSMLLALSDAPLVVAGKSTFASEIIEKLGLINMASDMNTPWPIWPLENMLSDPPHFFILADGSNNLNSYKNVLRKLGLDPAKNNMHLIIPDRPIFQSPSPALIEDARYLAHLLNQL